MIRMSALRPALGLGLSLGLLLGGTASWGANGDAVEVTPPAVQEAADASAPGLAVAVLEAEQAAADAAAAEGVEEAASGTDGHPVYHLRPEPYSDTAALQLTLDELLELAVLNNIGLKLQNYVVEKGHYSVDQTYYAFDPQWSGSLGYSKSNRGGVSATTGGGVSGSESYQASARYSVPREYGDAFQFSYDLSRSSYSLLGGGGDDTEIPTTYGGSLGVSYTRPLGRGAGKYVNRIPRYLASNNLQLAYDRLDDQVRRLKQSVLDTYFQAVAGREAISVREASLDLALKQLERAVERYKVGLAIQADVLQAENSVLSQRSQLLSARTAYAGLLDQLTLLLGLPQELLLGVDTAGALLDLGGVLPEDLWLLVQANSYDLKSLNTQLANLRLTRDQQLNQLKPDLGLSLNYGRSGEDRTLPLGASGMENESYSVGLNWSATPGQRTAKAQLAQTDLDLASLQLSIEDTELQLKTALRTQQRDLATKYEQISLAESNLKVLEETYNIQVERNSVGLATTLDVVEAEEALLAGRLALLQARVTYQQTYRQIQLLAGVI